MHKYIVILKVSHVIFLYFSKNEIAFKIIKFKISNLMKGNKKKKKKKKAISCHEFQLASVA
jgi:hypothetical protein